MIVDEWPEKDRLLAESLIHFEETAHCSGCGQLRSKAWDEDSAWDMGTVHCRACEKQADDSEKVEPGDLRFLELDEKSTRIKKARNKAREDGQ